MANFKSQIKINSNEFKENREGMLRLIQNFRDTEQRTVSASLRSKVYFDSKGKLLPHERLSRVLDPGAPFLELQSMAGYAMTDNGSVDENRNTSIPGAGIIAGIGYVSGVRCCLLVNNAAISAGALSTPGIEKFVRIQRIALENKLPLVMLNESAGANLEAYRIDSFVNGGRMFANLVRLSAAGIPTISVLHGSSTAGGAYLIGLSDVVIAVKKQAKAFLAGPPLLKAATGEIATDEDLGGADMHGSVSGLFEFLAENDNDALRICRDVVRELNWSSSAYMAPDGFAEPIYSPDEIAGVVPVDYRKPYDVREVVARLVDGSDFNDFKPRFGSATVCLEGRIHGFQVGFIGNNGPIDNDGAAKATYFIQRCCQLKKPIVYLQNTTGYMVGTEHERRGMIKNGSKMIQAMTTASIPQITLMIGASFGAGNYGMCGRGYEPEFVLSWPNARLGLMGPEQAGMVMRIVGENKLARKGHAIDQKAAEEYEKEIVDLLNRQSDALYASGRLIDDGIIDPRDTRSVLAFLLGTIAESKQRNLQTLSFGVGRI